MEKTTKREKVVKVDKSEQIKDLIMRRANDLFDRPSQGSLVSSKVNELVELITKI